MLVLLLGLSWAFVPAWAADPRGHAGL